MTIKRYSGITPNTVLCLFLSMYLNLSVFGQESIYLESNYQLAWGGDTFSESFSSNNGNYFIKYFDWSGRKGVDYPVCIFDAGSFRLLQQIPIEGNFIDMKITSDDKTLIIPEPKNDRYCFWSIESGKKIREIPTPVNPWGYASQRGDWDISSDGRRLLNWSIYGSKKPVMIDVESGKVLFEMEKQGISFARFLNINFNILLIHKKRIMLLDSKTGILCNEMEVPAEFDIFPSIFTLDKKKEKFLLAGSAKDKFFTYYGTVENDKIKILRILYHQDYYSKVIFSDDKLFMYTIRSTDNLLRKYSLSDGSLVLSYEIVPVDTRLGIIFSKLPKKLLDLASIRNGEYILVTDNYNVSYFYNVKENKVKAWLYSFGKEYAFITPDGRMDGTRGAIENLQWVRGEQKIPLSATYDQMFTPNLMAQIFGDKLETNTINLSDVIKFTPEINITSPSPGSKTSSSSAAVTCELKANGDEIEKVRIFVNDKLVSDETRGMKAAGSTVTFNVTLLPGVNSIKAVAVTKNGYQSAAAETNVTYSGVVAESRLFVLAIGIDKYKNPSYTLNYAAADAAGIAEKIRGSGTGIFKDITVYFYKDETAVRDSILGGFRKIASMAQPQDAFIFFYAGHGVMSEGSPEVPKDFFLALYDVTQLYGRDELLQAKGISAAELRETSRLIAAQKQVVFLDACQSGAAVETFAMRGAAEEKAILQLARSTGSYMIASTGSDQFATEFRDLGHGVFTYALLQGLNCSADGAEKDRKVTIKELEAYLNDNIPVLTEKFHGTVQYPKSWSKGMDFPVAVCK